VLLPDNTSIKATESGHLPLSNLLTQNAKKAHVLRDLHSASLISLGQLCDDNCNIILTKEHLTIFKNNQLIITGTRNQTDGLWDIPLTKDNPDLRQKLNVILIKNKTKQQLANYLHGCCFGPNKKTFIQAIRNGNFITWPGLESSIIERHMITPVATAKGHLDQERKNLNSTKVIKINDEIFPSKLNENNEDFFPSKLNDQAVTQDLCAMITPFEPKKTAYSDLTGRFPYKSSRGNEYLLVVYDYDSNAILVEAIKNRTAAVITKAWTKIHQIFKNRGAAPNIYILDNEISNDFKNALKKYNVTYQLTPPHMHRRNAAERAIRTFKNHFLTGLAMCDPNFPVAEWDRLLEQAQLTLNLLRTSRLNPHLSAHAYLFGNFDFNRTPLAPPGTRVVIHEKPRQRASWAYHGVDGWYIGPSQEHYRCVKCYLPLTRGIRDADTVSFHPHSIEFPAVSTLDYLKQASDDILHILCHPQKSFPYLEGGEQSKNAYLQIAKLLNRAATRPTPIPTTNVPPQLTPTSNIAVPRVVIKPPPGFKPIEKSIELPKETEFSKPVTTLVPTHEPTRVMPQEPSQVPTHEPIPMFLPAHSSATSHITRDTSLTTVPQSFCTKHAPTLKHRTVTPIPHVQKIHQPIPQRIPPNNITQPYLNKWKALIHPVCNHIYNNNGKKETIDSLLKSTKRDVWLKALSNEWGRLAQGNDYGVSATDAIEFISRSEVPKGRDVTYATFVCDHRPLKSEQWRVRIVAGGDKLSYTDNPASPATNLLETKILLNSVISDTKRGARFCTADLKDHFLGSPMERPEYMKIPITRFPIDIIKKYTLDTKQDDKKFVYVKIKKGMYGLKQAAKLAYKNIIRLLTPAGYYPVPNTNGIWRHKTRSIRFCLCVDDFGIKYFDKNDVHHLLQNLGTHYKYTIDWKGDHYCGFNINWNYEAGYVDISIQHYIKKLLERLNHQTPPKPIHAPHEWQVPVYGKHRQYVKDPDTTPLLDKSDTKYVQSVVGALLYYARAIEHPLLVGLNETSMDQANPTQKTKKKVQQLLDFAATYPNAIIRYHTSDMILHAESDAAYLVLPNATSRIGGYFYLSSKPPENPNTIPKPMKNGPIHIECSTLKHVVASAAEAETGGLFKNGQLAVTIRVILEALDHPQPPTPMKTDNSTACSFANDDLRQKRSKSWDMRYNWLRCRENQKQLRIYWDKGANNKADYYTKHFAPKHHKTMRGEFLHVEM
jgi:hypothetical protein